MNQTDSDKDFAGAIPRLYATHLVPLIFESYAADLAGRLARHPLTNVLEIAAGTGVVTRRLAATLPSDVSITATDLNQAMLEMAAATGTARTVEWRQADAMQLPFEDERFDAVVCQFGVMFFPDKSGAFAEAHRVLRRGGVFIFNVWDRIEENEFADTITQALATMFPHDPPRFMARIPHGYYDHATIAQDLAAGGFVARPQIDTVAARSQADSPRTVAVAYCQGTPVRHDIEARDSARLDEATDLAAEALAERFGRADIDGKIQAHVIQVGK